MINKRAVNLVVLLETSMFYIFSILIVFTPVAKSVLDICYILLALMWLFKNYLNHRFYFSRYFKNTNLNLPILSILIIFTLTILTSIAPLHTLRGVWGKWIEFFVLFFVTIDIIDSLERFKKALWVFTISSIFFILAGYLQFFSGRDIFFKNTLEDSNWVSGHFDSLNTYGAYIILVLPIFIFFLLGNKNKLSKLSAFIILFLSSIVLLLTSSIESWIALIASLSLLALITKRKIYKIIIICILLLPIVFTFVFSSKFRSRSNTVNEQIVNTDARLGIWKEWLKEVKKKPLLGNGINTTKASLITKYSVSPILLREENPHNFYLFVLIEAGVLGLLAYLWLLFRIIKILIPFKDSLMGFGLFAGYLAFLLVNIMDRIWDKRIQCLFWIIIGLIVAYSKLSAENKSDWNT